MAVYNYHTNINESSILDTIEPIIPSSDSVIEVMGSIVREGMENFNAIFRSIGIAELAVYESTGSEMVYEEEQKVSVLTKILEWFKRQLQKIVGLWQKIKTWFDKKVHDDAKFIANYKKRIARAASSVKDYNGFNFTHILDFKLQDKILDVIKAYENNTGIKSTTPDSKEELEGILKAAENRDDILSKMRAAATGVEQSVSEADFGKSLFSYFRGSKDSKGNLPEISVKSQLEFVESSGKLKEAAEKTAKHLIEDFKKSINIVNKEKEQYKNSKSGDLDSLKFRYTTAKCEYMQHASNIISKLAAAHIKAAQDANGQAKSILIKAMGEVVPPKEEPKPEVQHNSAFLSDVVFK